MYWYSELRLSLMPGSMTSIMASVFTLTLMATPLTQTGDREREFAMAAASVGDSFGIALSAALSFPVHNYFCSL